MTRRWQTNLLLVVVVSVLVLIAVLRPGIEKPEAKPRLSAIQDADINRVIVERPKAPTIVLGRKNGDTWFITQPRKGRTNPFMVSSLLRIIRARSEKELSADANKNLGRYGLDNPKAIVKLDNNVIRFGDSNPVNNQQYVLYNDRVHMIDHRYFWAVSRRTSEFLSKRLIEQKQQAVSLTLPRYKLSLVEGSWQLTPAIKSLTADRIKQVIDDWTHAQALAVKDYEKGRVTEWVRISFKPISSGKKATTLSIGIVSRSPELILYRPDEGLQYHFPQDLSKRLLLRDA